MRNSCCANAIRCVTALERTHQSTFAPVVRPLHQRTRKADKVLDLESESAEGIAGKRVETGGDQDQIGNEAGGGGIDASLECIDVLLTRPGGRHRDVPNGSMGSSIIRCTSPGIPRPLMHRDKVDVGLILD